MAPGFSVQSFGDSLILQAPVKTIERALQTRMDTLIATKHSSGEDIHFIFSVRQWINLARRRR